MCICEYMYIQSVNRYLSIYAFLLLHGIPDARIYAHMQVYVHEVVHRYVNMYVILLNIAGIPDSVEGIVDTDGDGVPNFRDLDR
jgi:hypothetical protein